MFRKVCFLDETSVLDAVSNSVGFLKSNFFVSMVVFLLITIALTIVIWVELYLQSIGFIGVIISFFLVLVVLVPFFEQAKSYAYLMRNDLLKGNEFVYARAPRTKKEKPKFGVRLREKQGRVKDLIFVFDVFIFIKRHVFYLFTFFVISSLIHLC